MNQKEFLEEFEKNLVKWIEVLKDQNVKFNRNKLKEVLCREIRCDVCPASIFWRALEPKVGISTALRLIDYSEDQSFYYEEHDETDAIIEIIERVIQ